MADSFVVVGNWKANGTIGDLEKWAVGFEANGARAALCVPHPYLEPASRLLAGKALVGAQDVSMYDGGSHTGSTTARMIADCGASMVLVGHSERRAKGEGDEMAAQKVGRVTENGLACVLCVGETLQQREDGELEQVLRRQVGAALAPCANRPGSSGSLMVAYEPVWAIGTGVAATEDQVQQACALAHGIAREVLGGDKISVLYGGSVDAGNAGLFAAKPDVDGLLVGGASLDAVTFSEVCKVSCGAVGK